MPAKKKAAKKKAAARKPRRASSPAPPDESTQPATRTAGKPATRPAGQRVMSVKSRRDSFGRVGIRFSAHTPTTVKESEIGAESFERILAEPQLRCEMK